MLFIRMPPLLLLFLLLLTLLLLSSSRKQMVPGRRGRTMRSDIENLVPLRDLPVRSTDSIDHAGDAQA